MSIRASVIVCTRNRPDLAEKAIASVGAEMPDWCELVVVDQSSDDRTRHAVERLAGQVRVRYVPADPRGLSAARNVGAAAAAGDLLLYTDDDCLIDPGWVELWDAEFAADPGAGLGFGRVDCPPEEARKGYTPDFLARDGDYGLELFLRGHGCIGMGANMVVRRRVLEELSGFDERLGAGARFIGAEDHDMAYRVLRAGHRVLHRSAPHVWHYGTRVGVSASQLTRGYMIGISAMYVKHLRCGDLFVLRLMLNDLRHHVTTVVTRLARRTPPWGLGKLLFFFRGIQVSLLAPVDRRRRLFELEERGAA